MAGSSRLLVPHKPHVHVHRTRIMVLVSLAILLGLIAMVVQFRLTLSDESMAAARQSFADLRAQSAAASAAADEPVAEETAQPTVAEEAQLWNQIEEALSAAAAAQMTLPAEDEVVNPNAAEQPAAVSPEATSDEPRATGPSSP